MSSVALDEDLACIPGLGENKQKPRKCTALHLIPCLLITGSNFCYGRLPVGIQSPKTDIDIESEVPSPILVPVPKVKIKIG